MKVTVIPTITAYPWGAPGHCMGALVEELLEAGHEVQWFVAPLDMQHAEVSRLGKRCASLRPLPAEPKRYLRAASLRRKLDRWWSGEAGLGEQVRGFDPDFVYLNQGGTWCGTHGHFFDVLRPRAGRFALICHLNRDQPPFPPDEARRARLLAEEAKAMFFPSAWTQKLAERQVVRPIPKAERFFYPHRFAFEKASPWPESPVAKIAFVGRLDPWHKGLDLALQALADLKKEGKSFCFTLYGHGAHRDHLGELAEHLGLRQEVVFAGHTEAVEQVWQANEILLMPSRHEGCAVAMTEAMGFGRPVIATAVGGAPEWIEDSVTGFLAAVPDQAFVTDVLRRALAQRVRWPEMGLAAHAKFKQRMPERPARVFLEALQPEGDKSQKTNG